MSKGIIILAAGAATRMGKAKMLLPFSNGHILSHILEQAVSVETNNLCMVTGFYHAEIEKNIDSKSIEIIYNQNWKEGMASSIRKGLLTLLEKDKDISTVLLLVADQPYLHGELLKEIYQVYHKTNRGIVAAQYGNTKGTPVLFDKKYFAQLLALKGDIGAKSILQQNEADCAVVNFPLGAIDIDTPEDYENLQAQKEKNHA
jgi:molybdenum cofactor cytidylyltransferase